MTKNHPWTEGRNHEQKGSGPPRVPFWTPLGSILIENRALARVLDDFDVAKHVFYHILTSAIILWLEFWTIAMFQHVFYRALASKMRLSLEFLKRRRTLARVLDGSGAS